MHIPIDPSAPQPIYEQIRAGLAEAIVGGDLAPGDALPSLRGLARDLRVSVITTTRAYNELVADGLVDAVHGKGVFVRAQDREQMRRKALQQVDDAFAQAIRAARAGGIDDQELSERLAHLLEEVR